ncbi:MAG TPA: protein kinase [Enhygromyxa sp.]|nr:protein kinase [Enhygromyxa sp.]
MQEPSFALTDAEGRLLEGWTVIDGPWDVGSEERWSLRLADGRRAVLGRLSPALARDESVRRRWVRDVERLIECAATSVAPVLAVGPRPDPRDPAADPPWRLRLEPEGEPLTHWLARAPVPMDELAQRGAALADALHAVHLGGAVVRNLHPRDLVWTRSGRVVLTDVGLARVDLLSSHTASSLLISGSAYAAPEQLLRTVVDQRADLYSLGVILWQAATGSLPFGEGPALLRERVELPPITALRRDAPPVLELLLLRLLAEAPGDRLASAAEVAWVLRGGAGDGLVVAGQTICQHCGAALRLGQRLCLACGRVGVQFGHQPASVREQWGVELTTLSEDAGAIAALREFVGSVAQGPLRPDEFVIGDVSLYSEQELVWRKRLPARLFDNLDRATAEQLVARMRERKLDVRVVAPDRSMQWSVVSVGAVAVTIAIAVMLGQFAAPVGAIVLTVAGGMMAAAIAAMQASSAAAERRIRPLYRLRDQPAALPASDPLVARVAALLDETSAGPTPADVRAQLGELALLVQRLVDRRAELTGLSEAAELQMLTAPVEPLIGELERRVRELARCDRELAELDEATMVRALAAVDAKYDEPGKRALERQRLLDGLDRLRSLEDRRMAGFHRLLEASTLLRRAVDLGLGVHDPAAEQERRVKLALAALG